MGLDEFGCTELSGKSGPYGGREWLPPGQNLASGQKYHEKPGASCWSCVLGNSASTGVWEQMAPPQPGE
jgi:hypothetical protein